MQRGLGRKLDELNRVVIPKEMLRTLDWPRHPNVEVSLFGEWIMVQLAERTGPSGQGGSGGKAPVDRKVAVDNPVQVKLIHAIQGLSERNTMLLLEMAEALNNVSADIPDEGTSISG